MVIMIEQTNLSYCSEAESSIQHVRELGSEGLQLTTVKGSSLTALCGELLTDVKDVMDVKNIQQLHVMREAGAIWEPLCLECYHESIEYIFS